MSNTIEKKVMNNVTIQFQHKMYDYEEIISGVLIIGQGKGRKRLQLEFVWNKQLDTYPKIKNRKWDKQEIESLAGMLNYYCSLRKVVR